MAEMTRVVLADDHDVVRAGLRNALVTLDDIEVVGEAGDGRRLMDLVLAERPDLVLIDVAMPDFDPVASVRQIRQAVPGARILVVSAYAEEEYVTGLLAAGVDGYHLKDQPLADLQLAVRRVLAGERWISSPLVERLIHQRPRAAPAKSPLTRRQREMLRLLTQGYDNRRIAQAMDLSVKTVENHLTSLYRALGVDSRLAATHYANTHPDLLARSGSELEREPFARPAGDSLSVLLVDDNPRYREQLARMIARRYPSVHLYEADDAAEAIRLAGAVRPHLALIDVVLSDDDGIQCARRLKAQTPTIRVVMMSAYPDREFRRLSLAAGAVAFLDKKDLDATAIHQVIDDALGRERNG
jgi:DNA-binding NarL/FixJ family response regulator